MTVLTKPNHPTSHVNKTNQQGGGLVVSGPGHVDEDAHIRMRELVERSCPYCLVQHPHVHA